MIRDFELYRRYASRIIFTDLTFFWPLKWQNALQKSVKMISRVVETYHELVDAQLQFETKRSLTRILRIKPIQYPVLRVGDLIDVYVKCDADKRRKWLMSRAILTIDRSSGTGTGPTENSHAIDAAFEEVCAALAEDSFEMMVQESIVTVDRKFASAFDDYTSASDLDTATGTEHLVIRDDHCDDNLSLATPSNGDRVDISWPTNN